MWQELSRAHRKNGRFFLLQGLSSFASGATKFAQTASEKVRFSLAYQPALTEVEKFSVVVLSCRGIKEE